MNTRLYVCAAAALCAALVLTSFSYAEACDGDKKARKPSKLDKKRTAKVLKDERLKTTKLFGIEWSNDWKAAVVRNRVSPRTAKPILYLRILGNLAGQT